MRVQFRRYIMCKLLTRLEAAERMGISHDTLDRLRMEGKIAFIQHKPGGKVLISEDAIEEYFARATHPAEPVRPVLRTYRKRRMTA